MRTGTLLCMTLVGVALSNTGCPQTPRPARDDAKVYADALERTHEDLDSALEACGQILNPGLAQDCALAVVVRSRPSNFEEVQSRCSKVPPGPIGMECWFQSAQILASEGREDEAALACLRAGVNQLACGQHLWQPPLRDLVEEAWANTDLAEPPAARLHPGAVSLLAQWAQRLGGGPELEMRFWQVLYREAMKVSGDVSPSLCEGLTEEAMPACLAAVQRARTEGLVAPRR